MSGSTLTRAVYAALLLALLGLLLRLASWLWRWIGPPAERPSPGSRLVAALRGGLGALAGGRLLRLVAALLLDVLLQRRLFSVDPVRGAAHLAIVLGMSGLVLLHALQRLISERLVAGYASTLDPWLWLRDLFGLLLIGGILVGIWRRRRRRGELPAPRRRDPLLVGLLLALCASGFLLGAVKIVSPRAFQRMVDEYAGGSAEETLPLRVHWARELGVALDGLPRVPDPKLLAAGKEAHEASCASCHSRPRSAVASYALSRALRPAGGRLARWNLEGILLQLHLALMLAALVYLPWSRLLHLIASPVSLLANAGASPAPAPENRATRRALAREACVRCGLCDERCSVRPLAALLENPAVLPAEKLLLVSALQRGRFDQAELRRVADGAQACTECGRCTRVCPSGIDLVDLWAAGRAELDRRGAPRAAAWIKAIPAARWAERLAAAPATPHPPPGLKLGSALTAAPPSGVNPLGPPASGLPRSTSLIADRRAFVPCVQCQTCTNVCPVVGASLGDASGVDATPQKVMNLLRLGLADLALGTRMVWDCATCYQCQEHCPAGIPVTDVLYELRNRAHERLTALASASGDEPAGGGR